MQGCRGYLPATKQSLGAIKKTSLRGHQFTHSAIIPISTAICPKSRPSSCHAATRRVLSYGPFSAREDPAQSLGVISHPSSVSWRTTRAYLDVTSSAMPAAPRAAAIPTEKQTQTPTGDARVVMATEEGTGWAPET